MKRLIAAAVLATGLHGLLLASSLPWQAPARTALNPAPLQVTLTAPPAPPQPTQLSAPSPPREKATPPDPGPAPKPEPKATVQKPPRPKPTPQKPNPPPAPKPASKAPSLKADEPPRITPVRHVRPVAPASPHSSAVPKKMARQTLRPPQKSVPAVVMAVPRYRDNPPPAYPRRARRKGVQGTVRLAVWVDRNGTVGGVEVARSSGYDILDRSALDAVKNWRFEPATRDGQPVASRVEVPVEFKLKQ